MEIELVAFYDDQVPTLGKLALTLNGKTEKQTLYADKYEYHQYENIFFKTEFPEDVLSVNVDWASHSNKPLLLAYTTITVDNGPEYVHFLMQKNIENGSTEVFEKRN